MPSLQRHEGYLLLDHRESPGIPDELSVKIDRPVGSGCGMFEAPTYTCTHCSRVVVTNPLRNRERAYCPKCDHYICDGCGAVRVANGGECKTVAQLFDELSEVALKKESNTLLGV